MNNNILIFYTYLKTIYDFFFANTLNNTNWQFTKTF